MTFDFGIRDFIYGGDEEWQRRRWFMLFWLAVGWFSCLLGCLANLLLGFSEDLTSTILTSNFTINGGVVLGYLGATVWDKKNTMAAAATVTETVVDAGPPKVVTKTETVGPNV